MMRPSTRFKGPGKTLTTKAAALNKAAPDRYFKARRSLCLPVPMSSTNERSSGAKSPVR